MLAVSGVNLRSAASGTLSGSPLIASLMEPQQHKCSCGIVTFARGCWQDACAACRRHGVFSFVRQVASMVRQWSAASCVR